MNGEFESDPTFLLGFSESCGHKGLLGFFSWAFEEDKFEFNGLC